MTLSESENRTNADADGNCFPNQRFGQFLRWLETAGIRAVWTFVEAELAYIGISVSEERGEFRQGPVESALADFRLCLVFCSCLDAFLFVSFVSWYTLFRILSADFHALARRSGFLPCPYCLLQAPPARPGLGITNAGEQIRPAKRNGKKTEGENTDEAESVAVDKRPERSGFCAF